jgi:large subunit ribosomal protein L10
MDNPRPEKVAVVDEVRSRLDDATGAILTEYRGLTVGDMAALRLALERAGGDFKVYKNTLVKLATMGGRHEALQPLLEGPTGIAFVTGEISAVAKALRDYARTNPHLVVKGGMFGDDVLSSSELTVLADLPSRDVLLARYAGALAAPMQKMAGLLGAIPRNFAYGLSALIGDRPVEPDVPEGAPAPPEAAEAEAPAVEAPPEAVATEAPAVEAPPEVAEAEAPATEVAAEASAAPEASTEIPAGEAPATDTAAEEAEETAPEATAAAAETSAPETEAEPEAGEQAEAQEEAEAVGSETAEATDVATSSDENEAVTDGTTDSTTDSTTEADKTDDTKEQNGNG